MEKVRDWWSDIPEIVRHVLTAMLAMSATLLAVGALLQIPTRVSSLEEITARHDTEIREVRDAGAAQHRRMAAADLRAEYLICLVEAVAGEGTRSASQCGSDFARASR